MAKPTIAFLTFDWSFGTKPLQPNGCAWYRCFLPMQELKKTGEWETGMGFPGYNDKYGFGLLIPENKAVHGWDIVVLKLMMLEKVVHQIPKAQELGQKIVIDIDDHHEGLEPTNLAYRATDPSTNPKNNREHYIKSMELADALITSTPFLYQYYKNKFPNKPIFMVRNGIDIDRWKMRKDKSNFYPIVGWVGATPWRSNDLETLSSGLGSFIEKNNMRFHHSGSIINAPTVEEQLEIPHKFFSSEPMKPILKYPEMFRRIDIGIVPLSDVKFNYAKSYIKGLEYTAAGIPFISQDLEEYSVLASEGVGRVAKNMDEWLEHLEFYKNPKNRNIERQNNRRIVQEKHSMEIRGIEWNKVYKEIFAL